MSFKTSNDSICGLTLDMLTIRVNHVFHVLGEVANRIK